MNMLPFPYFTRSRITTSSLCTQAATEPPLPASAPVTRYAGYPYVRQFVADCTGRT